jgi:hypothetical protein
MNWEKAEILIRSKIFNNVHLDSKSEYKYIEAGPNYYCKQYDYNNSLGFKVQIGANNYIEVPFSMLKTLYFSTITNNGIYDRNVIVDLYPMQVKNHGCHVHVIGKIFVLAGIMKQDNSRHYSIL